MVDSKVGEHRWANEEVTRSWSQAKPSLAPWRLKMATGRMTADTSVSCPHPRPKFRARARARRPPRAASSARARYPRASLARGHARVPARGGEYPRRGGRSRGGEPLPAPPPPMAIPLAAAARPGAASPPPHPPAVARPGAARPPGGCPSRAASPSRRWSRGGGWGSRRPWRRSEGAAPLGARPRAGGGGVADSRRWVVGAARRWVGGRGSGGCRDGGWAAGSLGLDWDWESGGMKETLKI
jgi:hypothetical protein